LKRCIVILLLINFLISDINDNCKIIGLNHIKVDNAVPMLKAMGYSVIDYDEDNDGAILSPRLDSFENANSISDITIIKFPSQNSEYLDSGLGSSDEESSLAGMSSYLGGSSMPDLISGEPPQRIMVCYESGKESEFRTLLEFLKNKIDVPSSQIMIEALVIEINSDELEELGINLSGQGANFTASNLTSESTLNGGSEVSGLDIDYSDNDLTETVLGLADDGTEIEIEQVLQSQFSANIQALLNSSSGEILSKPSVMVMDGRQARIQIGQHIPITRTTSGTSYTSEDIEYVPTGIILNIRPRISNNNDEILMQVETIITDPQNLSYNSDGILITPIINNRKVETFIRIENNNPFIIGGLISDKKYDSVGGIPFLSKIPLIGKLFSNTGKNNIKKEVIIVLTPHIISNENTSFSRVIPQDSHLFDSFGNDLFPNSYRLKNDDIFDLDFIYESSIVSKILDLVNKEEIIPSQKSDAKTYDMLSKGVLPGEDILVRRMIYEIIEKEKYYEYIDPEKILFPEFNEGIESLKEKIKFHDIFDSDHSKGLLLKFLTNEGDDLENPFTRPAFKVEVASDINSKKEFKSQLYNSNQASGNAILISEPKHLRRLYEVIILKKILSLNPDLNLNIKSFKAGVEIIFPSTESLVNNELFIDKDIAQYYYEANLYYEAFENKFNMEIKPILSIID
tara:strand:+ start:1743 stop:3794 length:2052 start_codon:yes stop_codon:yes gene_type:complete